MLLHVAAAQGKPQLSSIALDRPLSLNATVVFPTPIVPAAGGRPNPADRRAQLFQPTPAGHHVLHTISVAQKAWADALGTEIGEAQLIQLTADVAAIRQVVSARPLPGPVRRRRNSTTAWLRELSWRLRYSRQP